MGTPGSIDPVLALLHYLEGYRRSWRCWLIGGPAAVDDLSICATERLVGVHIRADLQMETVQRRWRHAIGGAAWRIRWYDAPDPHPPPEGSFVDGEEAFPLRDTRVVGQCELCHGAGRRRCGGCGGTGRSPQGSLPCSGCGGRGEVPCYCGERVIPEDLVSYEEVVYTYRHERHKFEAFSEGAEAASIQSILKRAWRSETEHLAVVAETVDELAARLEAVPGLGAAVRRRVQEVCGSLRRRAQAGSGGPAASGQSRLRHQWIEARVARAVLITLRQGPLRRQFWATGEARRHQSHLSGPDISRAWAILPAWSMWLASTWREDTQPLQMLLTWAFFSLCILPCLFVPSATGGVPLRAVLRGVPAWFRYLQASRRAVAPAEVAVASPRPAESGRLYALFGHLAAHAQLADPSQGGTVLDDLAYDLWQRLHQPAATPGQSSTYRVELGAAVPGPRRLRLLHLVGTPGAAPEDLCRAALRRAAQVWLVLPAGLPAAEADRWTANMADAIGEAAITLLCCGNAPGLEMLPATRARLAGRRHRVWRMDLDALCARYAAGQLSAEEAAAWVRELMAEASPSAPLPAATPADQTTPAPLDPLREQSR